MDAYFTPSVLARVMADLFVGRPQTVADFASGDGSLLSAAREKWPNCGLIATDINPTNLSRVRERFPKSRVGKCDFLKAASRGHCGALRKIVGKVSLVLLNPPFSCRGGTKLSVSVAGTQTDVSVAMAFTVIAFNYLCVGGQLVALLPAGCINAQRDMRAWRLLETVAKIEIINWNGKRAFEKCFPATCIVRITKRSKQRENDNEWSLRSITTSGISGRLELVRGSRPMFSIKERKVGKRISLVHSTELQGGIVKLGQRYVAKSMIDVRGPAVLIPRVGLPRHDKIAVLGDGLEVALSDCVFALRCQSIPKAVDLQMKIRLAWDGFKSMYGGTGAPYLTVKRLVNWLLEQGYSVVSHSNAPLQLRKNVREAILDYRMRHQVESEEDLEWSEINDNTDSTAKHFPFIQ